MFIVLFVLLSFINTSHSTEINLHKTKQNSDATVGFFIGRGWRHGSFYHGVEGGIYKDLGQHEFDTIDGSFLCHKHLYSIHLSKRIGFIQNKTLFYFKVGVHRQSHSINDKVYHKTMIVPGLGIEKFYKKTSLRLEYNYYPSFRKDLVNLPENHIGHITKEGQSLKIGFSYLF